VGQGAWVPGLLAHAAAVHDLAPERPELEAAEEARRLVQRGVVALERATDLAGRGQA